MEKLVEKHGFLPLSRFRLVGSVNKSVSAPATIPPDTSETSDQELMRRAQRDDAQAFAQIYQRHATSILSYLYRFLGNVEDIEAIAQEVFLRAYRFRATYQYPQRLTTWLFAIARNLAINQSRRRKRDPVRNVTELGFDGMEISGDASKVAAGAAMDAEKREEIDRMMAALEQLPPDQKETIVLGVFQDLSYAEMEEITGAKAVTLRSRMFHGLKKLAMLMEKKGNNDGS
jgi:RNA polymerase sigma-70 factor, ECF subfamily